MVAPILSLSIGKILCLPASSLVPTGPSTVEALYASQASSLMTVPSILEELCDMPDGKGTDPLATLQFVGFGGGLLKASVGERLEAAGVQVVNTLGTTETGPLSPMFVPTPEYDWRYFRVRKDLDLKLEELPSTKGEVPRFKLIVYLVESDTHFELQDLLISNPKNPGTDFTTIGRNDDLIVLATGEKVLPSILENKLSANPSVKTAVAYGEGQFEIGVIIEPSLPIPIEEQEGFKSALWPIILEAGEQMDAHARLSSTAGIVMVPAGKKIPRTDKGSVARKEVYRAFELEIAHAYRDLENNVSDASLRTLNLSALEEDLKSLIQYRLNWKIPAEQWGYKDDFFEMGMDSLQATRLRRFLVVCVPVSLNVLPPAEWIGRDFIYQHPSISQLAMGIRRSRGLESSEKDLQNQINEYVRLYSVKKEPISPKSRGSVILLTGSTGSLGSHLLSYLASLPDVDRVICLNRRHPGTNIDPQKRQLSIMQGQGLTLSSHAWSKIHIIQTNLEAPLFGLAESTYDEICSQVTHILHNAWPMDFNRKLPSFRVQFQITRDLLNLARAAHAAQPIIRPKLLFISSIAVVGQYGSVHGGTLVPEIPIHDQNCTTPIGYAAAKMVCEQIIEAAVRDFGSEIQAAYVRVGQMSGSKQTGSWNVDEHFPALVKSSQRIGKLPRLNGVSCLQLIELFGRKLTMLQTFSWITVDRTAQVLSEVLLTTEPSSTVFHLENPIRQSWHDALAIIGRELNLSEKDFLPFDEWLDEVCAVSEIRAGDNPVKKLSDFFKTNFKRMSTGTVTMATDHTRATSPSLQSSGQVQDETISGYVKYWRSIRYIN